jgi:citrate synthase
MNQLWTYLTILIFKL